MYSVVCDRCRASLEDGANWSDKISAESYALDSKWLKISNKHYCPDCYKLNELLNDYVNKKKK